MSEKTTSIHEIDLELICEYFSHLKRQGPGSPEMTLQALSFIDNLTEESKIIDVGCGTGGQTLTLAQHTAGSVTGIDLFPGFIDIFNANMHAAHLQNRVRGIIGSMDKLPYESGELDLIWAEGSIYNIGFRRGLTEWRRFLKTGGYIAVSEASWFTDERPDEIFDFWNRDYPEIDTIPVKVTQMQEAGYVPVATFILPDTCWTTNYHDPQIPLQEKFLQKYRGNRTAEEFIAFQKYEAELYRKYSAYYGYVFYIGRKTG